MQLSGMKMVSAPWLHHCGFYRRLERFDLKRFDLRNRPKLVPGLTRDRSKLATLRSRTVPAPEVGFTRLQPCLVTKSGKPDLVCRDKGSSLDLSEHLPYLINRVGSALVERFSADALAKAHLSIASWRVLAVLATSRVLRQTDLAEMTSIEVSTLSRLITRLVRAGLVRRTRSRANGREVAVALTPRAQALLARLVPIAAGLQDAATRGLAKRDLATLRRVLRQMHGNLTRGAS